MSLIRGVVLIASLTLAFVTPAEAQWTIGVKGGLSTADQDLGRTNEAFTAAVR